MPKTPPVSSNRRRWRFAVAALGSTFTLACGHAEAQNTANAAASAIVQSAGLRTGTNGTNYFNIAGSGNGSSASFGVLDFSASAFNLSNPGINGVQGNTLTLTLSESNSSFTAAGPLEFYLTTNTTTSISNAAGASPLKFQTATSTGASDPGYGIDPLLGSSAGNGNGTLYDLGSAMFTPHANNLFYANQFTLTLSSNAMQAFVNSFGSGGFRLVIAATSPNADATFSGATTTFTHADGSTEKPTLTFTPTYSTANNLYWQSGSGTWTTTDTSWNPSNTTPASSTWNNDGAHTAVFAQAAGGTVAVGSGIQASGVQFDTSGYTLTPAAAGNTLTLSGAAPFIQVTNAADTATVNVPLAGTAGMTKTGAGTLVLGAQNTYTGTTTLSAGTLQISADNNLGTSTGGVILNGGTLHSTAANLKMARAFNGSGGIQVDSGNTLITSGVVNLTNLTLSGGGTLALTNNTLSLSNGNASNAISGTVTFTTAGATLTASYGGTSPSDGQGIINLGGVTASQASGTVTLAANSNVTGTIAVNVANSGATLNLPGGLAGSAVIAKTGAGTLVLGGDNSGLTGTGATPVSFRQGTAGASPASGGVISIAAGNANPGYALGTGQFQANGGTVSNDSGVDITLAVASISLGAQNATGTPGGLVFAGSHAITVTGPISLFKSGTITYQHAITVNTPTTLTGMLTLNASGTSTGLTVLGSSTLTLNGTVANAFTEPVTVATTGTGGVVATADGTFAANTAITLNSGARLTLSTGAMSGTVNAINDAALLSFQGAAGAFGKLVLSIGTGQETVGGLYLAANDGTLTAGYLPAGTYGSSQSTAQYKDDALFSGTGVLVNLAAVPEPSTWGLMLAGLGLLALGSRARRARGA